LSDLSAQYVLAYDVGGSHVSAAVCERSTYFLYGLSRAPLPNQDSSHLSAASFGRLIHTLGETAAKAANIPLSRVSGAGLAMPGPFDYANGISQMRHKLQSLYGVDLKSALAVRFQWQPAQVRFVNDAAAFLLGETGAGAAKGCSRAIGLTLGTGIGCAFAVDGHIVTGGPGGEQGVPPGGEIWNLPYNGATVEDFVSTRFLRQHYLLLTGVQAEVSAIAETAKGNEPCPEIEAQIDGGAIAEPGAKTSLTTPAADIVTDRHEAHCRARLAFLDFGRHLGLALKQYATAFDPDVIVVGGGIARAANLFLPATRKAIEGLRAKLVISMLMDEAPLTGSGVHWFTESE
jgi:glucokinase